MDIDFAGIEKKWRASRGDGQRITGNGIFAFLVRDRRFYGRI